MRTLLLLSIGICLIAIGAGPATKLDVSQLRAAPDGNYLVTLELNGSQERLNLKVQGNKVKCVNATDPKLRSVEGELVPHGIDPRVKGAFIARFSGIGSQLWIFQSDGAAAVREIPDRGEQQSAIPVAGSSLDAPKAK